MKVPVISIIIPCFRRSHLLNWGLYSLFKQNMPFKHEVIIVDDGLESDGVKEICNKYRGRLNIKYIFIGHRNSKDNIRWRSPAIAINTGVKNSIGNILILSSPEIYLLTHCIKDMVMPIVNNSKKLTITTGYDDTTGDVLEHIKARNGNFNTRYKNVAIPTLPKLETKYPFFMGINKQEFLSIGGYDERFAEGFCFEDNDFVDRLLVNKCMYHKLTNHKIIHLYHTRKTRAGIDEKIKMKLWRENEKLYISKKEQTVLVSSNEISSNGWHLHKIPKIAHFYWGNDKLPYLRYLSLETFRKYNPDWKIYLHIPSKKYSGSWLDTCEEFEFTGKDYYSQLKYLDIIINTVDFSFAEREFEKLKTDFLTREEVYRSDFLRWWLLYEQGGLWSDIDVIYFKSMADVSFNNKRNSKCDTIISTHPNYGHSVGFMLSSKGNSYYLYLLRKAKKMFNPKDYQSIGVTLINDDFPTALTIEKRFPNLKVIDIPIKTIYAYDALNILSIYNSNSLDKYNENSIALHWYAGHRLAKYYTNQVTHKNYWLFNNVLCKTIQLSLGATPIINNRFKIITTVYNAEKWIKKCIKSIKAQTYKNFEVIIVDDCSTDQTRAIIKKETYNDPRFTWLFNGKRKYALENTVNGIKVLCKDDEDIIVIVDGDDWLASDNVLSYLNTVYQKDIWTTWGQFILASTNKVCKYKEETWCNDIKGKFDRSKMGRFIFSHLRTYKYKLFKNIKDVDLRDETGKYYTTAGDVLIALPIIEMAGRKHRKFISKIMYCYNNMNSLNDMKRCPKEQMGIYYQTREKQPYKELK